MIEDFLTQIENTYSDASYQRIVRAYYFAKSAHKGQLRHSGEEYFIHPVSVATILVELGLDCDTIIAALLHDVVEDTGVTEEEIETEFGHSVVMLVDGVTKLSKLNFKSREEAQAENLRRMFLAMSNDIRVIIIKLADRLHNMRTLSYRKEEDRIRVAKETLEIYAPIAARLGIASVKGELEDLCLRYLHPDDYYDIAEKVASTKVERQKLVESITADLRKMLDELGIKGDINGRPKHFYSIWRKMKKGKSFEEIYDLTAVRIIVDTVKDCYAVLGAIHTMWKPLPGRFKDYISVPKTNMYQSLHTTVLSSYGSPFEIQIRTHEMHRVAEYGIAAHWKYKQGVAGGSSSIDDNKLAWIRSVMELQNDVSDSREYLDMLKLDLYVDQVFVFTPKGEVINLPAGATGIDFAYAIHSQVGNKCVGIKINSKMVPVDTVLTNGDVVEVVTSNTVKGPSRDWLKFVKTPSAKSKIKSFFKKELRDENVKRGKDMLEREAKHKNYQLSDLVALSSWRDYIKQKYNISDPDEIFGMVGYGELTTNQVLTKMIEFYKVEECKKEPVIEVKPSTARKRKNDSGIIVKGFDDLKIRFSHCCTPVPGDEIIGYISRSRGVTIHRADCPNVKYLEPERLIEAVWPAQSAAGDKFVSSLGITAEDRTGLVIEVATLINNMKVTMTNINARAEKNGTAVITVTVEIGNVSDLENLINKIGQLKGVTSVSRTNNV